MSEFTGLHDKVCIFSCLVFNSHEYSVAYENLHPSTDAYKQVAYKQAHLGMWDLRRLASVDSKSLNMVQDAQQTHWNV